MNTLQPVPPDISIAPRELIAFDINRNLTVRELIAALSALPKAAQDLPLLTTGAAGYSSSGVYGVSLEERRVVLLGF
jgi:hypothetical protein